ncbi:hypothetical protein JMV73_01070 [Klebsiella pneumoniae]|nr:hypothetical protein JMV73_01070 [Klebsiella pneumoniae]
MRLVLRRLMQISASPPNSASLRASATVTAPKPLNDQQEHPR